MKQLTSDAGLSMGWPVTHVLERRRAGRVRYIARILTGNGQEVERLKICFEFFQSLRICVSIYKVEKL